MKYSFRETSDSGVVLPLHHPTEEFAEWRAAMLLLRPISPLRISLLRFLDKISEKFPTGLGVPPLKIKTMLELNPLKSRILVQRLAVLRPAGRGQRVEAARSDEVGKARATLKFKDNKELIFGHTPLHVRPRQTLFGFGLILIIPAS